MTGASAGILAKTGTLARKRRTTAASDRAMAPKVDRVMVPRGDRAMALRDRRDPRIDRKDRGAMAPASVMASPGTLVVNPLAASLLVAVRAASPLSAVAGMAIARTVGGIDPLAPGAIGTGKRTGTRAVARVQTSGARNLARVKASSVGLLAIDPIALTGRSGTGMSIGMVTMAHPGAIGVNGAIAVNGGIGLLGSIAGVIARPSVAVPKGASLAAAGMGSASNTGTAKAGTSAGAIALPMPLMAMPKMATQPRAKPKPTMTSSTAVIRCWQP